MIPIRQSTKNLKWINSLSSKLLLNRTGSFSQKRHYSVSISGIPPCIMYLGCSRDTYKPLALRPSFLFHWFQGLADPSRFPVILGNIVRQDFFIIFCRLVCITRHSLTLSLTYAPFFDKIKHSWTDEGRI